MMVRWFRFSFPFLSLFLILAVAITAPVIFAQADCPTIIEEAITVLGNSCDGISRNNACYGNVDVEAQFTDGFDVPFDRVGDLAELVNMQRISTSPIDRLTEEWGIALLNVQANIPDTIPGQSVIFMLMGDSEMENGIEPDGTLAGERIPITTRRSGSLRSEPSASSRILTFISGNTQVSAQGISEDGQWLRVTYNGQTGWMIARMAQTIPTFTTPVAEERFTPMQSFYLRTGIGRPDCVQAPNTLMVQGPKDFSIDLTVNGADIRIGSTIFLRNISDDVMQLIVADGQVTLYPDTPNARIVPEGGFSTICLDAPRDLGVDGLNNDREVRDNCFWTVPQRFTDWEDFETFPNLPPNLLIYDIELPNEPIIVEDCDVNPDWLDDYTVVVGDTLSQIAPRYALTAEELGFGNCLVDYDLIIPNQILRVPRILVEVGNPPPVETAVVVVPPPPPLTFVDLQFTATTSLATPEENEDFTYTITVTNIGTQDATNVFATVTFPFNQAEYVSHVASLGSIIIPIGSWNIGIIPAGGSATLTINATARPGEAAAGAFALPATLTSLTETDTNAGNNAASVSVDIGYYTVAIVVDEGTQAVANEGRCSLTEAINNANGDNFSHPSPMFIGECATGNGALVFDSIELMTNINVTDAVTYPANGTNALPPITDSVAIDGLSHNITLTAGTARLFHVQGGVDLALKTVTVTGGNPPANEDGGAVYNNGTVRVTDMANITGNLVSGTGGGGGIYNNGGTVLVNTGGIISNNIVGGAGTGGGIKNVNGVVNIDGGYISNNQATTGYGGGIASSGISPTVLLSNWTTMSGNSALSGGGIHITGGTLTVNGFVFDGNTASNEGGGIYLATATGPHNINAQFNNNNGGLFGGAVYVGAGTTVTFNTPFFTNNNANEGGAIYSFVGFATINNGTFTGNTAGVGNGTAVHYNATAVTTFTNTVLWVGHATPNCAGAGGTFIDGGGNTGGDATCYP
jgi:uncharacterized repeat protein (TIGR01451 family)